MCMHGMLDTSFLKIDEKGLMGGSTVERAVNSSLLLQQQQVWCVSSRKHSTSTHDSSLDSLRLQVRDAVVPCWVLDWREDDFEGRDKREKAIPKPKCTAEQRRDMMNKIKSMTNDVHKTRAERVALESKLMELKKAMVEAPP